MDVIIKVNTAGSWANLVTVAEADLPAVKNSCSALAALHKNQIRFKALDPAGEIIAAFDSTEGWSDR